MNDDVHYWRKRCEILLSANIELKAKNQEMAHTIENLEHKLYLAKVQESLYKTIVEEAI